ncbi:crotonase/enoyl-CoA hydratase family protein [Sphingomonas histidinilytica]|jgi:enoyl-CoA hydratase|uniref:Enoyl-CoA hydratase n=1 Tax=Rhizorhabdus histidinilytica TaxID=439228 RepID=A0A1T5FPA1_9SPHN|nr:crotonase/enoyl-CoA hydratase family protein [Rhizorhabdus histidinilytica]MBO9377104.1 crotonase/enoyl-CoA hydratase family protein [Rhizorhabdus histidinilytica]QEH80033.1 crotonase/enoyl-CoA hydratase family protein [Sphingomonas sp. C8-2]SKB97986.1 enoyl-CoA hydratase [Rhizorhabdus histidinilytica]
MTDEAPLLLYEVRDGTAWITLNRPEKRNALSEPLQEKLNALLWEADEDNRVHAVVLRAAGPDFCSGYDLQKYDQPIPGQVDHRRGRAKFDDDAWHQERALRLRMALFDMHKPVIAQVHGRCLAGGTDLALMCDMVICADDAMFGFPSARSQGSLPSHMWLYLVGPQWAKRLLLTGDSIRGDDAVKIGLAMKAVPADRLDAEVETLAARLALIDADLLSANKRIVNLGLELMGARTLQRMAAEMDARGHLAASRTRFNETVRMEGLKEAVRQRDEPFGDPVVKL